MVENEKKERVTSMIVKGTKIFNRRQPIERILLLLEGSVQAETIYVKQTFSAGSVLGIADLAAGGYLYDYIALEDVTVYPVAVSCIEDSKKIFQMGKEYQKTAVIDLIRQIKGLISIYRDLKKCTDHLLLNNIQSYQKYLTLCNGYRQKPIEMNRILKIQDDFAALTLDPSKEEYFMSLSEIPVDIQNLFFHASEVVSYVHINEGANFVNTIDSTCKRLMKKFMLCCHLLFGEGDKNLFFAYYMLGMQVMEVNKEKKGIEDEIENMMSIILETKKFADNTLHIPFEVDQKRMKEVYHTIVSESSGFADHGQSLQKFSNSQIISAITEMHHTTQKVLDYSEIGAEKAESFELKLAVYRAIPDPDSSEDSVKRLRNEITKLFYEIYERVFFRANKEGNNNRVIQMFLNFGFLDERMVEKETMVALYYLDISNSGDTYHVYTIGEWLQAIYEGKRQPSKNKSGLDYTEHVRELKKKHVITDIEAMQYLGDGRRKVSYEINNMLYENNRITNGRDSVFCPIFRQQDFIEKIQKAYVSYSRVKEAMDHIVSVDFSAFYREQLYQDTEHGIGKMYIMKQVFPDIILMPNAGNKVNMWQVFTERKRDSPGRFIMPIFLLSDLDSMITYLVGIFRWELCKAIKGVYWNDVREKSLTSEYCGYAQFYRKNKELSEEAKEKVKRQLQKCHSQYREMFTKDYEMWIRYECTGSVRVNKVVRTILFTHCPFSKEYRNRLATQPMYQEAAAKYEREHQRNLKKVKGMHESLEEQGGEITPVLEENLRFYEEM